MVEQAIQGRQKIMDSQQKNIIAFQNNEQIFFKALVNRNRFILGALIVITGQLCAIAWLLFFR